MTKVSRKEKAKHKGYSVLSVRSTLECGDDSEEDTPVPIPNTEVKLLSADDTWRETARESRTLPFWLKKKFTKVSFFF